MKKMKKLFMLLFVAGLMSVSFTSCREKKETVGDKVEDVVDDVKDATN